VSPNKKQEPQEDNEGNTENENEEVFTEDDYMDALRKASQPLPQESDEETDKTSE